MTLAETITTDRLLDVRGLTLELQRRSGPTTLVDGVSLHVDRGEIVGVVGESGCGKSLTMLGVLGLLPAGVRASESSHVDLAGNSIFDSSERALQKLRGDVVSLIPSDAGAALDPVARIGAQLDRALRAHDPRSSARSRRERILAMFDRVRLPEPLKQFAKYPHQLSGGMQQRAAIAAALLGDPQLIIADEPTTALDVTVQAQVLALLLEIRDRLNAGILFVTHDMTAIAEICDRVIVMYAGRVVEADTVDRVVSAPAHPYSRALLGSVPPLLGDRPEALTTIPGTPPSPGSWPEGCRFRARCPLWEQLGRPEICATAEPTMPGERGAACHFAGQS